MMKPRFEALAQFGAMRTRIRGPELDRAVQAFCKRTGWKRHAVADAAGVSRSTLYNRLSEVRKGVSNTAEKATIVGICSVVGVKYDDVAEDVT